MRAYSEVSLVEFCGTYSQARVYRIAAVQPDPILILHQCEQQMPWCRSEVLNLGRLWCPSLGNLLPAPLRGMATFTVVAALWQLPWCQGKGAFSEFVPICQWWVCSSPPVGAGSPQTTCSLLPTCRPLHTSGMLHDHHEGNPIPVWVHRLLVERRNDLSKSGKSPFFPSVSAIVGAPVVPPTLPCKYEVPSSLGEFGNLWCRPLDVGFCFCPTQWRKTKVWLVVGLDGLWTCWPRSLMELSHEVGWRRQLAVGNIPFVLEKVAFLKLRSPRKGITNDQLWCWAGECHVNLGDVNLPLTLKK